jgi:hypothetical protein
MPKREVAPPEYAKNMALDELRARIFRDKEEFRNYLAHAPVEEKLRILEEMRDFTAAMQGARDANRASVRHAWKRVADPALCGKCGTHAAGLVHYFTGRSCDLLRRVRRWFGETNVVERK